jgi:hypothetical protein
MSNPNLNEDLTLREIIVKDRATLSLLEIIKINNANLLKNDDEKFEKFQNNIFELYQLSDEKFNLINSELKVLSDKLDDLKQEFNLYYFNLKLFLILTLIIHSIFSSLIILVIKKLPFKKVKSN